MLQIGGKGYYVYILSSINRVLYVGFTDCLVKRINQHKKGTFENAFTKKYKVNRLLYWECFYDKKSALAREKQIKSYSRNKKINLFKDINPEWQDWYISLVEISKRRPII